MPQEGFLVRALGSTLAVLALATGPAEARSEAIEELRITARRLSPAVSEQLHNTTVIDRARLEESGGARLDEVLRQVPGFGLFRRQSSRASHPTTQGVTLRGLGPSGAGRTLILLDGVPQNDPFGGWIDWSRLSPDALDSVSVTRGGGAGAWGNAAMAGVIRLYRRTDSDGGSARLRADSFGGYEAAATIRSGSEASVFAAAKGHGGDGPFLVAASQRGPVDVRTSNRGGWAELGSSFAVGDTSVTAAANYSEDHLVNGIAIARSRSRIGEASFGLTRADGDGADWEAHAYIRRQGFNAVFAAVTADRAAVTPSLDQFRVPTTGAGGNILVRVPVTAGVSLESGADVRYADGATHENFTFANGAFTRERAAGGRQTIAGVFAEVSWQASPQILVTGSGRADLWRQAAGYRREINKLDGATVRSDAFPDYSGTVGSFRLGASAGLSSALTLRGVAYSGFRIPTLNELYRPFRVGNDITEANPALKPERLLGGEAGVSWDAGAATWSLTLFHAKMTNAVSNITVQSTPGQNAALNVFVPAGGVLRQRRNLDRIAANGIEADLSIQVVENVDFDAGYLYASPKVRKSRDQPALEGLRLAQVAKHQGRLSASWRPVAPLHARVEVRMAASQYDDDQNTRRLRGYTTVDAFIEYRLDSGMTVFLSGENILNESIQAGVSATGLVTIGNARTFSAGTSYRF